MNNYILGTISESNYGNGPMIPEPQFVLAKGRRHKYCIAQYNVGWREPIIFHKLTGNDMYIKMMSNAWLEPYRCYLRGLLCYFQVDAHGIRDGPAIIIKYIPDTKATSYRPTVNHNYAVQQLKHDQRLVSQKLSHDDRLMELPNTGVKRNFIQRLTDSTRFHDKEVLPKGYRRCVECNKLIEDKGILRCVACENKRQAKMNLTRKRRLRYGNESD